MSKLLVYVFSILLLVTTASAQPLADRVPADALLYAAWGGAGTPGFEGSHLQGVVKGADAEGLIAKLLTVAAGVGDEPDHTAKFIATAGAAMWNYPSAIYVAKMEAGDDERESPRVAVMWDAGKEGHAMAERVKLEVPRDWQGEFEPVVNEHEGVVVLTIGFDEKRAAAVGTAQASPLAKLSAFQKALAQAGGKPAAIVYVDIESILTTIEREAAAGSSDSQEISQFIGASSMKGIKRAIWTGAFQEKDWATAIFIEAPTPRKGIASLFDAAPVTDETLKLVPAKAGGFYATTFDLGHFMDEVRTGLDRNSPDLRKQFDAGLAMGAQVLGFNVETDLIRSLGTQWVVYTQDGIAAPPGLGFVITTKLKDALKAERALLVLQNQADAQGPGWFGKRGGEAVYEEGLHVHMLPVPFPVAAPSWAVHEGKLIISISPQGVATAAIHNDKQGSILEQPRFKEMLKKLGDRKANYVAYADLPSTGATTYQWFWLLSELMSMEFGREHGGVSGNLLPPYAAIEPHLSPAGGVGWADDLGYHVVSLSPFPGSAMMHPLGVFNPASAAFLGLIGFFESSSPQHARGSRMMQTQTQARGIHQGCIIYSQGAGGNFPPDFITLLDGNYFTPEYLISPMEKGKKIPDGFNDWPRDKKAEWIEANTSYVLVPGLVDDTDAQKVAVFEKLHTPALRQIAVVFNDNSTQMMDVAQADALITKQTGRSLKEWSAPGGTKKAAAADAYTKADKLYLDSKFREAADSYRAALKADPDNKHAADATFLMGKALENAGEKAAAKEAYAEFLKKYPDHASAAEVKKRAGALK